MQKEAKTQVTKRLQRIEGQVRGLSRMVEEDRYCIDIVTQISAVRAALRRVEELRFGEIRPAKSPGAFLHRVTAEIDA